ncbi:MAG TPA: phage tail protein [Verrucomicrobiae bacterium]|nr:phage tail protein [Verrucomicrobiae bacterium]HTZ56044.1 phage tail protein [Candidatus Acidoferrum sp.]
MPQITSSYTKYLPPILWENDPSPNLFSLGTMLCPFEKILTGIDPSLDGGILIEHGNNAVMTTVTQAVTANPLPQTVQITPGTGGLFLAGSSYTYNGVMPEVINVTAVNANTLTAVFQQNHAANQTIVNSSGVHDPIQTVIANTVNLYGPWTAPVNFLDWLAQWVALQLPASWDEYQRRSVISTIVGIYAQRGTKPGMYEFFNIYAAAKRQPRLVIDDGSRLLFFAPQAGLITPITALVSRLNLVAPKFIAIDGTGSYLYVCDMGTTGVSTIVPPGLWRVSIAGDYDYAPGAGVVSPNPPNPPTQQSYLPSTPPMAAPLAVAIDSVNNCGYLIDAALPLDLYRLSDPQVGTIMLSGAPTTGQSIEIAVGGIAYTLKETSGTLDAQATTWAGALNGAATFGAHYTATASGPDITIAPLSGEPNNDLLWVTASATLDVSATGPHFTTATKLSSPSPGMNYPIAMVVDGAGHPLILDRGAGPTQPPTANANTTIIDIGISGGSYTGATPHTFTEVVEPLSIALRASGHVLVGDAGNQNSGDPATIYDIDLTGPTTTNLLAAVATANNPLVAPTGIVEIDAKHIMVVDAGLRPWRPYSASPFTQIIAQQPAVYSVDLSVAPPVITQVSDQQSLVYPRGLVGASNGTLYLCDSGLPQLAGYNSQEWRSVAQQFAVVVNFQGDPAVAVYSILLTGTPTVGEKCTITIAGAAYQLTETGGTTSAQATAFAALLNANPAFTALYLAGASGAVLNIYAVPGTDATGVAISVISSTHLTLTGNVFATITLSGTPTTGQHVELELDGVNYFLPQTTADSLATEATTWASDLNGNPGFAANYAATADGDVLVISYVPGSAAASSNIPAFANTSGGVVATLATSPFAVGTFTLMGTPVTGETAIISVGGVVCDLDASSGNSVAAQAAAWSGNLNSNPSFNTLYSSSSSGPVINIFANTVSIAGVTLYVIQSCPHLQVTAYSEQQNRNQFLTSIVQVVNDEIPAQANWYLQSEVSAI